MIEWTKGGHRYEQLDGGTLLVDEALPGMPFFVAQRHHHLSTTPCKRAAVTVAEAVDDGIVLVADGDSEPDVAVFVLQLDMIAVTVAGHSRLGSFFFQVKVPTGDVRRLRLVL